MVHVATDNFWVRGRNQNHRLQLAESSSVVNGHLGKEFLNSAARFAEQPAFVTDQCVVTYVELAELTLQYAERLQQHPDWRSGSRVALRLENSVDYIAAFYGILIANGIAVPLPVEQSESWINQVVQLTQARWSIDHSGVQSSAFKSSGISSSRRDDEEFVDPELAAILFTSGSTGTPKGVMLSHKNLLANAASICSSLPIEQSDRTLALLPFCHAYGNSVLHSHLLSGATIVVAGSMSFPDTVIDAMAQHRITSYAGVPHLHHLLFHGDRFSHRAVPTLRYVTVAGGVLRQDLLLQFAARLQPAKFYVMYGQTEATARLSCLPADELRSRCGSIGRGIPGVELEVVDEHNRPVPPGTIGEIRARGDNIMLGYWKDSQGTNQVIHDNWLHTGDLATVDDEGYIYPHGRRNDLLKICGYRMHPAEVERAIARKIPTMEPVIVAFETPEGSHRLALFLIPLRSHSTCGLAEIRACCARVLPRHQRPDYVKILRTPPLTPSLKIDRKLLSNWAADAALRRSQLSSSDI